MAKQTSLWMDTAPSPAPRGKPPAEGAEFDVCVVGGGITGITAAALLEEAGARVAVVEALQVGDGVTGFTTAKLTVLQQTHLQQVRKKFGADGLKAYADANRAALELVARWVSERGIDCDFRRRPAITYTEDDSQVSTIADEAEAATEAGLGARIATDVDLPWEVRSAVILDEQAEFHPRRYLHGLAEGLTVFEHTRVTGVEEGTPCVLTTEDGTEIRARDVIVASHYPFLDRGLFFARLSPERSYVIGVRVRGEVPHGMFINVETPTRSIRTHPVEGGELLILGGEGHKTGQEADERERYEALESYARERFDVESVEYRWSAHDCMPPDSMPYVGKLTPRSKHIWVATGYMKWGMTNGTAAAMMLADELTGKENPWIEHFDPNRVDPVAAGPTLIKENINVAAHFFGDRISKGDFPSLEAVPAGEGGIVNTDEHGRVGAYRDESGELHVVNPTCTHLHCQVNFNTAEKSWDCPCHGSRFQPDGTVIQGPAVDPLPRVQ